jgi:hypothetical protein
MRGTRAASAVVATLLVLGAPAGCTRDRPPLDRLVIAAGQPGEVYHALGQALADTAADRWSVEVEVLRTAASADNLRLVGEGRADLGLATVDLAAMAMQGDAPFLALPIVTVARLYEDHLQIVVRADSGLRQVGDLAGLRVSTGLPGSGTEVVAARVLEAHGHGLRDVVQRRLSPADSAAAMRSGALDAFFVTGGMPTPVVQDLAAHVPIRILPAVPDDPDELQARYGEYYLIRSVTAGTYGIEQDVRTLGVPSVVVVRRDLPDEVAYRLTELLFTAKDQLVAAHPEARRLDRRSALATFPIPLHPGAARYYRDAKPMAHGPGGSAARE